MIASRRRPRSAAELGGLAGSGAMAVGLADPAPGDLLALLHDGRQPGGAGALGHVMCVGDQGVHGGFDLGIGDLEKVDATLCRERMRNGVASPSSGYSRSSVRPSGATAPTPLVVHSPRPSTAPALDRAKSSPRRGAVWPDFRLGIPLRFGFQTFCPMVGTPP